MRRALLTVHKFFPQHTAGTEVLTLKVAQELQRRGYEVRVVTANPPDRDARLRGGQESSRYEYDGVPVYVVEEALRLKRNSFRNEFFNPSVGEYFKRQLEEFAPDIVHVFHAQNLSASVLAESFAKGIPVIVSTTDFWFVCPIVQLKRPDGTICRGPGPLGKNCLTCYTPELFPDQDGFVQTLVARYPNLMKRRPGIMRRLQQWTDAALYASYVASKVPSAVRATVTRPEALRRIANRVSAITVPTRLMRDIFVENGIDSELIHHVPFGIDTAPLQMYQQKTASDHLRIAYVGTLFEHKGVDLLVQAFLDLPEDANASLTIYGDLDQFPEYSHYLQNLAKSGSPNAAKITFAGTFPNSEFGKVLAAADVLVVPSRWYENTPLVMQSAFAVKTPLIVTNLGGMAELVRHEFNGLVFELNNVNSLREQILRLLNEPGLLQKLSDNIEPERTTQQMVDQLEALYRKAWQDKRAVGAQHAAPLQVRPY
jgi:glycosyltransferase involved in cell wall biosynthesis